MMVYGQILNILKPHERQNLKNIFALETFNSKHLNYIDKSIAYIISQINQINIEFEQEKSPYKVSLKYICGDTPAMQGLGGFVESVGNANFPCRECKINKKDICNPLKS